MLVPNGFRTLPRTLTVLAGCLLCLAPAAAHDLWLEPSTWTAERGARLQVYVLVGERFAGKRVVPDPAKIVRFSAWSERGTVALSTPTGVLPAGLTLLPDDAPRVIIYESLPTGTRLSPATFGRYLREEGLDSVIARRAAAGVSDEPGREAYSRCAKSLLAGADGALRDQPAGCRVELVVDSATPGAPELSTRLLFDGRPLAGARIVALAKEAPTAVQVRRTDDLGRATFNIGPGTWLIRTVHMEPAAPQLGVDWESWWASLTFQRPRR